MRDGNTTERGDGLTNEEGRSLKRELCMTHFHLWCGTRQTVWRPTEILEDGANCIVIVHTYIYMNILA